MFARRLFLFATLAGCLFVGGPSHGHAEDFQAAKDFVATLADKTLATMRATDMPEAQRVENFRRLFVASVDMSTIGKLVLARHWRTASDEQRAEFLKVFEDVVVLTWSARFKDAANDLSLKIEGAKPDVDDGILVESAILRGKADPVPLVWRVRPRQGGGYYVVDLIAEGTSMVFTYREEYASVINQRGGKLEGLLDELKKLVARLQQPQGQAKAG